MLKISQFRKMAKSDKWNEYLREYHVSKYTGTFFQTNKISAYLINK